MSTLLPTAIAGIPRLTSYSTPQAPPPTPLIGSSTSPFDDSLTTLSSKAIGIVSPSANSVLGSSLKDQVTISVLNETTARPAVGIHAKLSAITIGKLRSLGSTQPFALFTGVTDSKGQISDWQPEGDSMTELSNKLVREAADFEWSWVLNLDSEAYWDSLGLKTTLPEVIIKFYAHSVTESRRSLKQHMEIVLGPQGFTMHE